MQLLARRAGAAGRSYAVARQVHGSGVLVLRPGDLPPSDGGSSDPVPSSPREGDALVAPAGAPAVAVLGADCGLVALASSEGMVAAVHAGWRGVAADVIGAAVAAMRARGATALVARLGPCIHPCCYRFGESDLAGLLARCPDAVPGVTSAGDAALDLPASLRRALERSGVALEDPLGGCTACSGDWFSFRGRADEGRHALVVWRP